MSIIRPRESVLSLHNPYHLAWIGQFTLVCIWSKRSNENSVLSRLPLELVVMICKFVYANPDVDLFKPHKLFYFITGGHDAPVRLLNKTTCNVCGRYGAWCDYHNE